MFSHHPVLVILTVLILLVVLGFLCRKLYQMFKRRWSYLQTAEFFQHVQCDSMNIAEEQVKLGW